MLNPFRVLGFAFLLGPFFCSGCRSTEEGQYAEGIVPLSAVESAAAGPRSTNANRISIKGTKAGTTQEQIAAAILKATRQLGAPGGQPDSARELRMATQAASNILGGEEVVLEGASSESVTSIAADLRAAGLIVRTGK